MWVDVESLELSYTAGGSVKWYSYLEDSLVVAFHMTQQFYT